MLRVRFAALALTLFTCVPPPSAPGGAVSGAPQCKMGSNGQNTCGYNCKLGSDGNWYCATKPDGQCALNASGTWSCP